MASSKQLSDDYIDNLLNDAKDHPTVEEKRRKVTDLYDQADSKLAERIVGKVGWCIKIKNIKYQNKKLIELFLIKALSDKSADKQLQSLIGFISFIDEKANVCIHLLRTNPKFREHFCKHPASFLMEEVLIKYCAQNPADKEMRTIEAEYQNNQYSQEGIKQRVQYFSEELRKHYKFPPSLTKEQQDLINISLFLMDNKRVAKRLTEIEKLIEDKARSEGKLELSDEKSGKKPLFKGYIEGEPYKHHKLLSGILYALATKMGFGKSIKVEDELDPESFFKMFKDKRLFKDKAFGGEYHGEWTHFLQWMCIALENADKPFLNKNPAELYQWLGTQPGALWDGTFETPPNSMSMHYSLFDARDVVTFHSYLRGSQSASSYPLLQQLLQGRAQKREQENEATSTIKVLKDLCAEHSDNPQVRELGTVFEEKKDTQKAKKSSSLLTVFADHFESGKNKKQYPSEFVEQVEKIKEVKKLMK